MSPADRKRILDGYQRVQKAVEARSLPPDHPVVKAVCAEVMRAEREGGPDAAHEAADRGAARILDLDPGDWNWKSAVNQAA